MGQSLVAMQPKNKIIIIYVLKVKDIYKRIYDSFALDFINNELFMNQQF